MRAIYRWRVRPGREEEFVRTWTALTKRIRAGVPGARGSMLLQSAERPDEFVAVARWETIEQWRAFRDASAATPAPNPQAANADLISAEPFEEVADLVDAG
jgi:heme-degrading monooxygenase HmoA